MNPTTEQRDQAHCPGVREDEVSEEIDAIARHRWARAERVGMQIAELPIKVRGIAFAGVERRLREAGNELGVAGQQLERIINLQMKAIRQAVADVDVGGSSQGGRA